MLMLIVNTLLIPAAVITAGFGVRRMAMRLVPQRLLIFWTYPGVAIHELSHAAACIPALAKVKKITLFTARGEGEVQHTEPRLRYFGPVLISFAPLAGGIAALLLLNWLLGHPFPAREVRGDAAGSSQFLWVLLKSSVLDLPRALTHAYWLDVRTWLMLYLGMSITLTMVPSKQDLKNCAIGAGVLLGLTLIVWLILENVLNLQSSSGVRRGLTSVLGLAHVAFFFYALDVALLLVLWGVSKLLNSPKETRSRKGGAKKVKG